MSRPARRRRDGGTVHRSPVFRGSRIVFLGCFLFIAILHGYSAMASWTTRPERRHLEWDLAGIYLATTLLFAAQPASTGLKEIWREDSAWFVSMCLVILALGGSTVPERFDPVAGRPVAALLLAAALMLFIRRRIHRPA